MPALSGSWLLWGNNGIGSSSSFEIVHAGTNGYDETNAKQFWWDTVQRVALS